MTSIPISYTETSISSPLEEKCLAIAIPSSNDRNSSSYSIFKDSSEHLLDIKVENTSFGGFTQLRGANTLFKTLSARVSLSRMDALLTPLLINNNSREDLLSLNIIFTSPIRPECFEIIEHPTQKDVIVVDAILESGTIITLNIPLKWFIANQWQSSIKEASNFSQWCVLSNSLSLGFSFPIFLKSMDINSSVVSLSDGSFILLSRSSTTDEFNTKSLTHVSYLDELKSKFSLHSSNNMIPDNVLIGNRSISTKAVLDSILLPKFHVLVTISIRKELQIWNLSTGELLNTYDISNLLPNRLEPVLFSSCLPKKLLKFVSNNRVALIVPIGNNYLKFFTINSNGELSEDKSLDIPIDGSSWTFHTCYLSCVEDNINIWISWCFGNEYLLQHCTLASGCDPIWSKCLSDRQIENEFHRKFFQQVKLASSDKELAEVGSHYLFDGIRFDNYTLKNAFNKIETKHSSSGSFRSIISTYLNSGSDIGTKRSNWIRFEKLCEKIKDPQNDIVDILCDNELNIGDGFIFIMKTRGLSIIGDSSTIDLLHCLSEQISDKMEKVIEIEGSNYHSLRKIASVLNQYQSSFDEKTLLTILKTLYSTNESSETIMQNVFKNFIAKIADSESINSLLSALNSIPNGLAEIQLLLKLINHNFLNFKPVCDILWGNMGSSLVNSNIRTESFLVRELSLSVILMSLTVDISEPIIELYNTAFSLHKKMTVILSSFSEDVSGSTLLKLYIDPLYNGGALVRKESFNLLISDIFDHILSSNYLSYIISVMLSMKDKNDTINYYETFLDHEKPISKLLVGLNELQIKSKRSYQILSDSSDSITKYSSEMDSLEKNALKPIESTASLLLVSSKVEYFYNLGLIYEANGMIEWALKSILTSLKAKSNMNDSSDDTAYLAKVFELSLKLDDFDMAYESIIKMKSSARKHPIRQFIYSLFQKDQLSKILSFEFNKDFDTVDDLVYSLAERSALDGDLENALRYYRTCYSLRLKEGDLRSSAEAIYRFNCIATARLHENKFQNLKLLMQNYLTILNILHELDTNDRWLIRYPVSGDSVSVVKSSVLSPAVNQVVTFTNLEMEYRQFCTENCPDIDINQIVC